MNYVFLSFIFTLCNTMPPNIRYRRRRCIYYNNQEYNNYIKVHQYNYPMCFARRYYVHNIYPNLPCVNPRDVVNYGVNNRNPSYIQQNNSFQNLRPLPQAFCFEINNKSITSNQPSTYQQVPNQNLKKDVSSLYTKNCDLHKKSENKINNQTTYVKEILPTRKSSLINSAVKENHYEKETPITYAHRNKSIQKRSSSSNKSSENSSVNPSIKHFTNIYQQEKNYFIPIKTPSSTLSINSTSSSSNTISSKSSSLTNVSPFSNVDQKDFSDTESNQINVERKIMSPPNKNLKDAKTLNNFKSSSASHLNKLKDNVKEVFPRLF